MMIKRETCCFVRSVAVASAADRGRMHTNRARTYGQGRLVTRARDVQRGAAPSGEEYGEPLRPWVAPVVAARSLAASAEPASRIAPGTVVSFKVFAGTCI
jgi:hypothetical protein